MGHVRSKTRSLGTYPCANIGIKTATGIYKQKGGISTIYCSIYFKILHVFLSTHWIAVESPTCLWKIEFRWVYFIWYGTKLDT